MDREELANRLEAKLLVYANQIAKFRKKHGIPSGGFRIQGTTRGGLDYDHWLKSKECKEKRQDNSCGETTPALWKPLQKLRKKLALKPKWATWIYGYVVLGDMGSPEADFGYIPELLGNEQLMLLIDPDITKEELIHQWHMIQADKGTTRADKRMRPTYLSKYMKAWRLKLAGAKIKEIAKELFSDDDMATRDGFRRLKKLASDPI